MAKSSGGGGRGKGGGGSVTLSSVTYGEYINAADFKVGDLMLIDASPVRITKVSKKRFSYINLTNGDTKTEETTFIAQVLDDGPVTGFYRPSKFEQRVRTARKLDIDKTRAVMKNIIKKYGKDPQTSRFAQSAQNVLDRL